MIALFAMAGLVAGIQISSKVPASHAVERHSVAKPNCMAAPAACAGAEQIESPYRLTASANRREDRKMVAMRFDGHPCRLIGGLKCPSRGREVWRAGEDVETTLRRSFGLLEN